MSNLQIATKYFGCNIAVNGQTFKMWGIVPHGVWYTRDRKDKVAKWGEWQAVLKPLSEITNEDAIWIFRSRISVDGYPYCTNKFISNGILCIGWSCLNYNGGIEYFDISHFNAKQVDFLRSRFYDIDNLIAKGEAVKK